jgi:catechol 2,3-dioxygenase-like lactoylglutathione lyase family enzyme
MSSDRFDHLALFPSDFEASFRFYREVMRWEVEKDWVASDGSRGVLLTGGGARVVIIERTGTEESSRLYGVANARQILNLDIHDVDKRFKSVPPGAHVISPPGDTEWGERCFVLQDPDGNYIAFNERRAR